MEVMVIRAGGLSQCVDRLGRHLTSVGHDSVNEAQVVQPDAVGAEIAELLPQSRGQRLLQARDTGAQANDPGTCVL